MSRRISRKALKQDEFIDAAVDIEQWFEHHWRTVAASAGIVVAVVVVGLAARSWMQHRREQAQDLVAGAVSQYQKAEEAGFAEPASLTPILSSLDQAIERTGSSPAARVARLYRGATLFHLGRLDEARTSLEAVASVADGADTLGYTAQVMLAHVQAAAGNYDQAIATLQAVADRSSAIVPPAEALLEIARMATQAGQADKARASLHRIVDEYPQSSAAGEARELLSSGS